MRIKIGTHTVPCRITMGALLRYKRETGKDASQMAASDVEAMLMLMYCCCKSASKADGEAFDMDFELFCDSLEPSAINEFNASINGGVEEKKTAVKPKTEKV